MKMNDNIAISDLKTIAKKNGYDHIICFATKGQKEFIATFGVTIEACDQAAQFGDKLKDSLGWPESLHAMPSRVKQLLARAEKSEAELEKWKEIAKNLADELTKANAKLFPVSWEDVNETSPAWIAYCNLRDKEK